MSNLLQKPRWRDATRKKNLAKPELRHTVDRILEAARLVPLFGDS